MGSFSSLIKGEGLRAKYRGYSGARPDILRLIEGPPVRVLDVGCGAGMLGSELRAMYPECMTIGVEPDATLADAAQEHMHEVFPGAIDDELILESVAARGPYDLIVCADVLEHVAAPDQVLVNLVGMLTGQGRIITSIPNVRHISTFVSLGLLGTWPVRDRGIHDKTHLRFFARSDILRLGRNAGLLPLRETRNLRLLEARAWTMFPAKIMDFWPFRPFLTFQYLHCWKRNNAP